MTDRQSEVLHEAFETVYGRMDEYGVPEDNFETIASFWSTYLDHDMSASDVAYMMILLKVAREAGGEHKHDTIVDIAGYAETAARTYEDR